MSIKKNLLIAVIGLILSLSFATILSSSIDKEFQYQDSVSEKYKQ